MFSIVLVALALLCQTPSRATKTTTAQHLDLDLEPLPTGTAYTVDLERASVSPERKATFFMALKAVHAKLRRQTKTTTTVR